MYKGRVQERQTEAVERAFLREQRGDQGQLDRLNTLGHRAFSERERLVLRISTAYENLPKKKGKGKKR